jgi:serine/threonine protein kinase
MPQSHARPRVLAHDRRAADICSIFGRSAPSGCPQRLPEALTNYFFLKQIGSGAKGSVYLARDRRNGRRVAVKTLRYPDTVSRARFLREAWCVRSLYHPHILRGLELVHEQGMDFLVTEYVAGKTLNQVMRGRAIPLPLCLRYAVELAQALVASHSAGIIHRDLKPPNIMIATGGGLKLIDFGLAKVDAKIRERSSARRATAFTPEGTLIGTADYMSPEQVLGEPTDERSDIFAFGVVFHEMLTGEHPFRRGTTIATMNEILDSAPRLAPSLPPGLKKVLKGCLEKNPGHRYQNAKALAADLLMYSFQIRA